MRSPVKVSRSYENDRSHGNFFQTGFKETALPADSRGKQNQRSFFFFFFKLAYISVSHKNILSVTAVGINQMEQLS